MKKTYIAIVLMSVISFINLHAEPAKTAAELKSEQRKIALEIFELRKTLVQSDPKLMELHQQKLKIHRLISERISGNAKMAELIEKAVKLQAKIEEINKPQESATGETTTPAETETKPEVTTTPKKVVSDVVTEPVHRSRKPSTTPHVIDETADSHIEENTSLSYE